MVTYSSKKKQMADNGGAEEKRSHKVSLGVRDRTERGGGREIAMKMFNFFIDDATSL